MLNGLIDLHRTFSIVTNDSEIEHEDWAEFFRHPRGRVVWKNVHEHPISVVLGEAGIGKTQEFKLEANRLNQAEKYAFFIPLNTLVNNEDWLIDSEYCSWQSSSETGYFFLDAIDESRLIKHSDFVKAIRIVKTHLQTNFNRVHLVISSRITDWFVKEVRDAVEDLLSRSNNLGDADADNKEVFVVSLDPLSTNEAKKLASLFGVTEFDTFWAAIEEGNYQFMATRPLDLTWLVQLWNEQHSFGKYLELIRKSTEKRLLEHNPNYQRVVSVSIEKLHIGVEKIAAALLFSRRNFIVRDEERLDSIVAYKVLPEWPLLEVDYLLNTAIFDESSFGRIKFHDRIVREYLGACWVHRQIQAGYSVDKAMELFAPTVFSQVILASSCRWSLCWLAAINPNVREWVVSNFPEMVMFDGDPESWDKISVNIAFVKYFERKKSGLLTVDWFNNESEYLRIGRCLTDKVIGSILLDSENSIQRKSDVFLIIKFAKLAQFGSLIFDFYQDKSLSDYERGLALNALMYIATEDQIEVIKSDIFNGNLSKGLMVTAIEVSRLNGFSSSDISKIFNALNEKESQGSAARLIKFDILPKADIGLLIHILNALRSILPELTPHQEVERLQDSHEIKHAWLFDVLAKAFEQLLLRFPQELLHEYPDICFDTAKKIYVFGSHQLIDSDILKVIHDLIVKKPQLRWRLALIIAKSEAEILYAISSLTFDPLRIVHLNLLDLSELVNKAHNESVDGEIWQRLAVEVSWRNWHGATRQQVLDILSHNATGCAILEQVKTRRCESVNYALKNRQWKIGELRRKKEREASYLVSREKLLAELDSIRDGSNSKAQSWFCREYFNYSNHKEFIVDFTLISTRLGQDIVDGLKSGLMNSWLRTLIPNPNQHNDGSFPISVTASLAGLQLVLCHRDVVNFSENEVKQAAYLAVWMVNTPIWLDKLIGDHETIVSSVLHPWIREDAANITDDVPMCSAIGLAIRSQNKVLLLPLIDAVNNAAIKSQKLLYRIVKLLAQTYLLDNGVVGSICLQNIQGFIQNESIQESQWLRLWLDCDLVNAWTWFETFINSIGEDSRKQQLIILCQAMDGLEFKDIAINNPVADTLVRIYQLLENYVPTQDITELDIQPMANIRALIPRLLVGIRGQSSHQILKYFVEMEEKGMRRNWLNQLVIEHAEIEVTQTRKVDYQELNNLCEPFLIEPKNEAQLFSQVMARLESIRIGVQEGPFSDRDLLCTPNILEKNLQHWLASKLNDTANRKFSVHREEEVDDDKKTDIQVSYGKFNVCIEIKPLDKDRSYSANSLVSDTLQRQIVDQYLKGFNSKSGILVLFRLDNKLWKIPNGESNQQFSELNKYLTIKAMEIKNTANGNIQELVVFPIDCTI